MPHIRLFLTQLAMLFIIAIVHFISLKLYLYWHFPLLNRVVHFSGGMWAALAVSWVLLLFSTKPRFIPLVIYVLAVGVAWEFFEIAIGMVRETNYALDTTLDLVMDVAGGIAGYFLMSRLIKHDTISRYEATENNSS